ncbi:hypothetical protein [Galactobacter caseinivorans]|uniref:Uncharacterized protein n=1 Tax=Galactobacter caseinivorans TaxID=2676123 RepID=A0A496PHN8_9MICC|nr:hypothetical protein [Galactobacter caseinivorans]RKW70004.1 hypothetical protein DWQ67_11140 [Galactobacter caseinivorans]
MRRRAPHRPLALTLAVAAPAALALAGCSEAKPQQAWELTYEVTVVGASSPRMQGVSYMHSQEPGKKPVRVDAGTVQTTPDAHAPGTGQWSTKESVTDGELAEVVATGEVDGTASCRIVLSDGKVLATATSEVGKTVTCSAKTPVR